MAPAFDGGEVHRTAREPRPSQLLHRRLSYQQASDAGWITKHLVKRNRDEFRLHHAEIEPRGRHKRSRIQQHIPTFVMGVVDQLERMSHTGEVGLRGKGKQLVRRRGRSVFEQRF